MVYITKSSISVHDVSKDTGTLNSFMLVFASLHLITINKINAKLRLMTSDNKIKN